MNSENVVVTEIVELNLFYNTQSTSDCENNCDCADPGTGSDSCTCED